MQSGSSVRMLVAVALTLSAAASPGAHAQDISASRQAYYPAPHNGAFEEAWSDLSRSFNAIDYQQAVLYESLWSGRDETAQLETTTFTHVLSVIEQPPARTIEVRAVAPEFFRANPDLDALLDWGRTFRRQVRDVLSDPESAAARDPRMQELVANYRAQDRLAVSSKPRSPDIMDAQPYSLEFRRRHPMYTALGWAGRWLEAAVLETLMTDQGMAAAPSAALAGVSARYREMVHGGPEASPHLLPLMPAVAPAFARAYPEAAAIIDNLHMLEESIADVLVAREIPPSAKRQEILRAAARFRDDSTAVVTLGTWFDGITAIGAGNMGGAVGSASGIRALPTIEWGTSMAGLVVESAPQMPEHEMAVTPPTREALLAIYERMMSDPVIRERVATDPVLERMLTALNDSSASGMGGMDHGAMGGAAMPGMDHGAMGGAATPGMDHGAMADAPAGAMTPAGASDLLSGSPAERERAIEFVVRLLSDPAVESRIHADPDLHALWTDPEVQRRLAELKRSAAP